MSEGRERRRGGWAVLQAPGAQVRPQPEGTGATAGFQQGVTMPDLHFKKMAHHRDRRGCDGLRRAARAQREVTGQGHGRKVSGPGDLRLWTPQRAGTFGVWGLR